MPPPKDSLWPSEPRTIIKHQVYGHYLQCWMGKICRKFDHSSIVDAFAGPGEYSDGPDGSPIVVAKTFLGHSANDSFNTLRLVCLEKRTDRRDNLVRKLGELPTARKLDVQIPKASEAVDAFGILDELAHEKGKGHVPTLWILDPFDWVSVPFNLVEKCLARPRDEVLLTWFAEELYRFCEDDTKSGSITRHFGGEHWKEALAATEESARKQALLAAYQDGIHRIGGIYTNAFSISTRNETPRYSLVFATHNEAGLECFNPVKWRLDPVQGRAINENRGTNQGDLFAEMPVTNPLRTALETFAGKAVPFSRLAQESLRLGFLDKHLRSTLDEMAADGQAVREAPLQASTRWPGDCLVRFYAPANGSE